MATLNAMHVIRSHADRGRPGRAAVMPLIVIGLFFCGLVPAAGASEIVDLRIGSHPDFTRVVFELDSPTGYRIERASPKPGSWELVVSLDATSIPRKVQSDESLIGLVKITPRGNRAVAQIQLRKDGLSLKEMILANPPRIVLDVLAPATAEKAAPKTVARKPAPKPAPAPKVVAKAEPPPPPKPVAKPAPEPAPERVAKAVAPEPSAPKKKEETPAPEPREVAESDDEASKPAWGAPGSDRSSEPKVVPGTRPQPVGEPSEGGVATMGVDKPGTRSPVAKAKSTNDTSKPRKVAKDIPKARLAETDSGMDMTTIIAAGVGLLVLVAGFVFWRRRSAGVVDEDEGEDVGGIDDNPFSGLASADGSQPSLGLGSDAGLSGSNEFEMGELEEDSYANPDAKEEPDEAPLMGQTALELDGEQTAVSGIAQPNAQVAGGSQGDEEVMQMMREFEKRIASLESRLSEVSDARERLERQVAAQTEELRVQRAAIARTQRAVRNMARPEDEGPTEPALRDPQ